MSGMQVIEAHQGPCERRKRYHKDYQPFPSLDSGPHSIVIIGKKMLINGNRADNRWRVTIIVCHRK